MMAKRVIFSGMAFFLLALTYASALDLPTLDKNKIRVVVAPGKTEFGEIIVTNSSPDAKDLRLYLQDWKYANTSEGTKEFMAINTTPLSCVSWINFSPAEFTIPAFGKQRVSYSIKVPVEAKGGYYACLFFETSLAGTFPKEEEQGKINAGVDFLIRSACLFYVEAEGTVKRELKFDNLHLTKENAQGPLKVEVSCLNTSNTDIVASGTYHIMDNEGVVYARGEFNNAYTFSGDSAKFSALWKEQLPKGKYGLVMTFDIGKALEEAGIGRGPIVVRESQIEVGDNGEVVRVGELK